MASLIARIPSVFTFERVQLVTWTARTSSPLVKSIRVIMGAEGREIVFAGNAARTLVARSQRGQELGANPQNIPFQGYMEMSHPITPRLSGIPSPSKELQRLK